MTQTLRNCEEDSSIPTESAAIHLKDFDVVFQKDNEKAIPVLVKNKESGVSLIKIYLISKIQLDFIINLETQAKFKGKIYLLLRL